jgi:ABC-type ATPase with predicted acetyltransferase domain
VLYKRDSVGRSVKVTLDNGEREIIELSPYNLEEQIFDIKNKKRIFFSEFIEKYLPKKNIKMLSKLNHKIIVQNEDKINLFSLKSEVDAERFMSILGSYFLESRRADTLFVRDINTSQRKYLYDLLINAGYSKQTLYRKFTTHPSKK